MKKILLFYAFIFGFLSLNAQDNSNTVTIKDTYGNENPLIDCQYPLSGKCLTLTASYPKYNKTSTYNVTSIAYQPVIAYDQGTALDADTDDLFFKKLALPFNFCFFNQSFNEIVIGDNGTVTFDTSQYGNVNYPNIQGENPNTRLPLNSIFGVGEDLVYSKNNDSEIYYSVVGTAPFRKFVINFYKGQLVNCDQTVSSQIVLSESSNEIAIFVDDKPLPCDNVKFKQSLIGIIGDDPAVGFSPSNRNTGIWEAHKEGYKFSPEGEEIIPKVNWYNVDNELIGSGDTVSVCPSKPETYTAKVSYDLCGADSLILQDAALVSFADNFPAAKDFIKVLCELGPVTVNLEDYKNDLVVQHSENFTFTFYNTLEDAKNMQNPQSSVVEINSNRNFYVRVQNPVDANCFQISKLKINLISKSLLTSDIQVCDFENNGVESNYKLSDLLPKLFNLPLNGVVEFYKSEADATSQQDKLVTANLIDNLQLYLLYKTSQCNEVLGPITIHFLLSPAVNSPLNYTFTSCDFRNDHTEPFDFAATFNALLTSDPSVKITYYDSYENALAKKNEISTVRAGKYEIFARIEAPSGCFSVATINMDVTFTEIQAKDAETNICFNGTENISINLEDYTQNMLQVDPAGITKAYYKTQQDGDNERNPISNLQEITKDGNLVSTTFYVRFTDNTGCYALKKLTVRLVNVIIAKSDFTICDFDNDTTETVSLSRFTTEIIGSQKATAKYFNTESDAQNNMNALSSKVLNAEKKLFVRIESYGCVKVFPIIISLVKTPEVEKVLNVQRERVCDNNNDQVEVFDLTSLQPQIYNGTEKVSFTYFKTYNSTTHQLSDEIKNPARFKTGRSATLFAKIKSESGCFSVSQINLNLDFLPEIVLKSAHLEKCDFDFNLNESFDLTSATSQAFDQQQNQVPLSDLEISYFLTENDAEGGVPAKEIHSPYMTTDSEVTVYMRFTSNTTHCYSVTPLLLKTFLPPKALKSSIENICDNNLDGIYDVNLTLYQNSMIGGNSSDNTFTFYQSESDASNKKNPIQHPENYQVKILPASIWVRVENIPGCYDVAKVELHAGRKLTLDNSGPFMAKTCDIENDGKEFLDLTQFQTQMFNHGGTFEYYNSLENLYQSQKIDDPAHYLYDKNTSSPKIFVKVSSPDACPNLGEINLKLDQTPIIRLPDYYFCPESFVNIQLDFSAFNIVKYEWFSPSGALISVDHQLLNVKTEGTYRLRVTSENGCLFSTNFMVKKYEVPEIKQIKIEGRTATVLASGNQVMVYSVDGINFQDSNVFPNLPLGVVTFYVKFKNSICQAAEKKGVILNIRNSFTPNGDGVNDLWKVDGLYVFDGQKSSLKIFDRYQKLIYQQESNSSFIWDGKTLERNVSTDAYWYVISLPDGRVLTGWVLLKNRN